MASPVRKSLVSRRRAKKSANEPQISELTKILANTALNDANPLLGILGVVYEYKRELLVEVKGMLFS